ncbi:MAG TPA: hypothetical protein VN720_08840, partial [Rudaea sp.]|nr:hypothetical protein [Rudaea sp.]
MSFFASGFCRLNLGARRRDTTDATRGGPAGMPPVQSTAPVFFGFRRYESGCPGAGSAERGMRMRAHRSLPNLAPLAAVQPVPRLGSPLAAGTVPGGCAGSAFGAGFFGFTVSLASTVTFGLSQLPVTLYCARATELIW